MFVEHHLPTGADLNQLRISLGLDTHEFIYIIGLTVPRWSKILQNSRAPLSDIPLSLLVWAMHQYPQYRFYPQLPSDPLAAYERYKPVAEQVVHTLSRARRLQRNENNRRITLGSMRAFGFMLGSDVASGNRWMKRHAQMSGHAKRLLYLLLQVCRHEGPQGLKVWYERVKLEAFWRGIDDLWVDQCWTAGTSIEPGHHEGLTLDLRRMRIKDILLLQNQYQASLTSTAYITAVHYQKLMQWLSGNLDQLIDPPSRALLLWALLKYPQYPYGVHLDSPENILSTYLETSQNLADLPYHTVQSILNKKPPGKPTRYRLNTKYSMSLMVGCPYKASNNWLYMNSRPRPSVWRLLHILHQVCRNQGAEGLQVWLDRVLFEARQRGIQNLWEHRDWVKRDSSG